MVGENMITEDEKVREELRKQLERKAKLLEEIKQQRKELLDLVNGVKVN